MRIESPSFAAGQPIPREYTCEGADRSPPLRFLDVPREAKSLALIVDDPDAPKATWVHWLLYNLPPDVSELSEGVTRLPPLAREGLNDWRRTGYGGPCPPSGRHRYFFKLYALDAVLPDLGKPTKSALEEAIEGHVLARAELIGTFQKRG